MGPGTADFCVAAVPGAFLRLSRELSLLHTMCVGLNTMISQNMLDIVKSCNEMKRFIEKDVLLVPTVEGIQCLPVTTDLA